MLRKTRGSIRGKSSGVLSGKSWRQCPCVDPGVRCGWNTVVSLSIDQNLYLVVQRLWFGSSIRPLSDLMAQSPGPSLHGTPMKELMSLIPTFYWSQGCARIYLFVWPAKRPGWSIIHISATCFSKHVTQVISVDINSELPVKKSDCSPSVMVLSIPFLSSPFFYLFSIQYVSAGQWRAVR